MQYGELARKYTDTEYLSKKEIANRLGVSVADNVWRQVNDYREKYRFPLDIKKYDRVPFSIVLTPALMEIPTATERLMFSLTLKYNHLKTLQSVSDNKSVNRFIKSIIKEDIQVIANNEDVILSEKDIEIMLNGSSVHLKDSHVYRYYHTLKMLMDKPSLKLDRNIFRDVLRIMNPNFDEESALLYRISEPKSSGEFLLGAPLNRLSELMNALFDFIDSDYPLSPFINASIFYIYLLYISPFEKYNHEIATLLFSKILADSGYGEIAYLLSLNEFLVQRKDEFDNVFEEVKRTGDITYGVVFVARLVFEAINWRIKNLDKIDVPKPIYSEVSVIERVVEKIVEKEVPIYIEKPVEKAPTKPNDKPLNKESEIEVDSSEADYFLKLAQQEKVEKNTGEKFEFLDDPFVKFADANSVTTPDVVDKVIKPIKTKKIKTIDVPAAVETKVDTLLDISHLATLDEEDFAKQLTEMHPLIKYHQALFFANHRVAGRYYTIGQFKEFTDCAYETARTSMDFLTSLGLYRKEQVKNKFVYTPNIMGGK